MRHFRFRKIIGITFLVIAGVFLFGNIIMLLWNNLMPVIFHLPMITFWQALGLLLLSKILFGGFRGGRGPGRWKRNMQDKWMNMSPEEKEKFKQEWGDRCGRRGERGRGRGPFESWDRSTEGNRSTEGRSGQSTDERAGQ